MALLHTPAKDNSFQAPDFALQNIDGTTITLAKASGENGIVIAFISNHCPYVKAIIARLVNTAKHLQAQDIGVIAIMPNDTDSYPDDSYDNMKIFAKTHGFTFPYVIDETQSTAKAYDAICTPDIFGFDASGTMQYRGRLDSAGLNAADSNTVPELLNAMTDLANGNPPSAKQQSSMGCSIKWR